MPLSKLNIPAGISNNKSEYAEEGRWIDCDLVRFKDGKPQKMGGWIDNTDFSTFTGACRGLFTYRSDNGSIYYLAGTNEKVYLNDGGTQSDITPTSYNHGTLDSTFQYGYGVGTYGSLTYGTARTSSTLSLDATTWSFDTFQEYVLAQPTSGRLYSFRVGTDSVLQPVTNAPVSNQYMIVSDQQHIICFGAGNDRQTISWASAGSLTDWSATATNSAGSLTLTDDSFIRCARKTRSGILVFTDRNVYLMSYLGSPFYYGINRVASNCGTLSNKATVAIQDQLFYMGHNDFFLFNGGVQSIPCPVHEYIFGDINKFQAAKVYGGLNPDFNEIIWFYPSASSTENNRYVIYNYKEGSWAIGNLQRTAWLGDRDLPKPIATDSSGESYTHEEGTSNAGTAFTSYITSAPFDIGEGETIMKINEIIPDFKNVTDTVNLQFTTRLQPQGTDLSHTASAITSTTQRIPIRVQGRQAKIKISSDSLTADWKLGNFKYGIYQGGKR